MSWRARLRAHPKPYRQKDFLDREKFRQDYRLVADVLLRHLDFTTAFDVGCGNGFLLAAFQAAGKSCAGIELSPAVREVLPKKLQPLVEVGDFASARGEWDLVCCVEVAEHLPPVRSTELVTTLTQLARRWIYFTAAPPGQTGRGHINCRPHDEWLAWFDEVGWQRQPELTDCLREHLKDLETAPWLCRNSLLLTPTSGS